MGFDVVKMFTKPLHHRIALPFIHFSFHFIEREVNDIVVMDFFA